jgi:hypothetical protein
MHVSMHVRPHLALLSLTVHEDRYTYTPELIHSAGSPSLAASAYLLASTTEHFCSAAKPTHAYPPSLQHISHRSWLDKGIWIQNHMVYFLWVFIILNKPTSCLLVGKN